MNLTAYVVHHDPAHENAIRVLVDEETHRVMDVDVDGSEHALHYFQIDYQHDSWGTIRDVVTSDLRGSDDVFVHYELESRPDEFLIGLVTETVITSGNALGSAARRTKFEHDALGRLWRTTVEPTRGVEERLTITRSYNSDGNIEFIEAVDLTGEKRRDEFTYDPSDATLVESTKNAAGPRTVFQTDPGFGELLATRRIEADAFLVGVDAFSVLDGYAREVESHHEGLIDRFAYRPAGDGTRVESRFASGAEVDEIFDRFGRLSSMRRQIEVGLQAEQRVVYDHLGRLKRRSGWFDTMTTGPVREEIFEYDLWGRLQRHTNLHEGVTEWSYDGLLESINSPRGGLYEVLRDSVGRVGARREPEVDGTRSEIVYSYGAFGQLRTATDTLGNATLDEYDRLGRLTFRDHPDSGAEMFSYSAFGQLIHHSDALGNEQKYHHDLLGRLEVVEDSLDGPTHYIYDSAPGAGTGLLHIAVSPDVSTTYEYDEFGRDVRIEQERGGVSLFLQQSYSPTTGLLRDVMVPNLSGGLSQYLYDYDTFGQLDRVRFDGVTAWEVIERADLMGRPTRERRGVMDVRRTFDPSTHVLTSYQASTPIHQPLLVRTNYEHDDDGRLRSFVEPLEGVTQRFEYDDRGRVSAWDRGSTHVAYGYDPLGNQVLGAGGLRVFDSPSAPHAVTEAGGEHFMYDPAGRRETSSSGWSATYTSFDLPRTITTPSGTSRTFEYDAFQNRAFETHEDDTTVRRFGSLLELNESSAGPSLTYNVNIGGERLVEITQEPSGVWTQRLLNSDGVGTSLTSANATGHRVAAPVVEPFGAVMEGSASSEHLFASHAFDAQTGLVDANGRVYDPATASFLSPDPVRMQTATALNLYTYAASDPVNFYDPTGFAPDVADGLTGHFWSGTGGGDFSGPYAGKGGGDLDRNAQRFGGRRPSRRPGSGRPYTGWGPPNGRGSTILEGMVNWIRSALNFRPNRRSAGPRPRRGGSRDRGSEHGYEGEQVDAEGAGRPHRRQSFDESCGAACLEILSRMEGYGVILEAEIYPELRPARGGTLVDVELMMELNYHARSWRTGRRWHNGTVVEQAARELTERDVAGYINGLVGRTSGSIIVHMRGGGGGHWVVVHGIRQGRVELGNPAQDVPTTIPLATFTQAWSGGVVWATPATP